VFKDLDSRFEKNIAGWEKAAASPDPLPEVVALVNSSSADGSQVTSFQALMALRCLRPDKVIPALQQFIAQELGAQFIDPPTFNLQKCFDDSDACSPLIFVLVSGADPMSDLLKLGDKVGKAKTILTVSLGQGQGPIAERAIADAIETGKWVCLQNCHLAESWLPTLERLVEEIRPDGTHPEFRLWLTAMPNPKFPVAVLQNGVKMTYEPPKGMRANLQGSFVSFDQDWFEGSIRSDNFRRLVFGVCFFHAQCLERKKFGALGWNIRYDFSESDLRISLDQLKIFIDDPAYPESAPPFAALTYLTGDWLVFSYLTTTSLDSSITNHIN
jgi:dynein heavy chain